MLITDHIAYLFLTKTYFKIYDFSSQEADGEGPPGGATCRRASPVRHSSRHAWSAADTVGPPAPGATARPGAASQRRLLRHEAGAATSCQNVLAHRRRCILVVRPTAEDGASDASSVPQRAEQEGIVRAYTSTSYVREGFPILSLSWWGWGSCYESVVLGAPFTPAGSTAEAERRVAHSISCDITL